MLTNIAIANVALISQLELEFADGFTALTGETGAGKSLLLDALGLALGARADVGLIRHGEPQAEVTAVFALPKNPALQALLADQGLEGEDGQLILRRQMKRGDTKDSATSKAWVNGTPVPATVLAQVGELLVDIHGQHGQQSLLNPTTQRAVLDALAGHTPLLDAVAQTHAAWKAAVALQEAAEARLREAETQAEALEALRKDLEAVAYELGEEETLTQQRHRLLHAAQLQQWLGAADEALSHLQQGAVGAVRGAARALGQAAGVDETLQPLAARLESLNLDLADAAHDVARAASTLDADGSLEDVDDRLHALKAAARKAKCDIPQLAEVLETLRRQTSGKAELEGKLLDLKTATTKARSGFEVACTALSAARKAALPAQQGAIQAALKALLLPHARLEIALLALPPAQWNATGAEGLELLLAANPGSPAQPVAKVASGGELSRLMLALKTVMYEGLPPQTVVFDEIDTGLSGAASSAVGKAMAQLGRRHQVLAVTHHPQVAAWAQQHVRIGKTVEAGETRTHITPLTEAERPEELARLLAGTHITGEARAAAVALLEESRRAV